MTQKRWDVLIAALVFTGLGVASGFYAARQSGSAAAEPAPDAGADAATDEHGHFSDAALANMGVEVGVLTIGTTTVERAVVATIVDDPLNEQPVQAPVGGVVRELATTLGARALAGETLAVLVRDGIEPPPLELTLEYAHPAHDEIHTAIRDLRKAAAEAQIARDELARVLPLTGGDADAPLLPLQRRIDLEYAIRRAEVAAEVAAHELERHGFSDEQITGLVAGRHVEVFDADHARRALAHGGLWNADCDRLRAALPAATRELPLAVAAIAELAAHGLLTAELCSVFEQDEPLGARFLEVASTMLRGSSLDDVRRLGALGAFEPTVALRAPTRAADWDVQQIAVRPGDRVSAGTPIAVLRDQSRVLLRIDPVGSEVADVVRALRDGLACRAVPLVPGAGPDLADVRIDRLSTAAPTERAAAWARVGNRAIESPEPSPDGVRFRSWALQPGLRYRLLIPTRQLENTLALPRTAVTEDGPDRIVFVPTGDGGFEEVPVVVVHEDESRVVVEPNDHLAPGSKVVVRGAFELGLAMHAGDATVEHDHHH